MRGVAADDTPKPLGKKCNKSAQCASGFCDPVSETCAVPPPTVLTGELTSEDPVLGGSCVGGRRYDAYTFAHSGGPLSLSVRGVDSGGGTLRDPVVALYPGGVPSNACAFIAENDDGGCGLDAYLEVANLAAGTYTAVVVELLNRLGTYTLERNTFTGGACPA